MTLKINDSVFDLLAYLYSSLSLDDERKCAIAWSTAKESYTRSFISKYRVLLNAVRQSSANEYIFEQNDMEDINGYLAIIEKENNKDEIYLLIIQIEESIEAYFQWGINKACYMIEPLNKNNMETGVSVYPYHHPRWDISKSERNRSNTINPKLKNYILLRREDCEPFHIVMHYWNDNALLELENDGWRLKIALSPVSNRAELDTEELKSSEQSGTIIKGLINEGEIENRVVSIFEELLNGEFRIIVFPELLGTVSLVKRIQNIMRNNPQKQALVILPSVCKEKRNTLTVLGPGGIHILEEDKQTPFILRGNDGELSREILDYNNVIHILISKELGNIAIPICAELLEPECYGVFTNIGMVNTIICSSFSPGNNAFKTQLIKGLSLKLLSFWINTCSAEKYSLKKEVPEPLFLIQLPDANPDNPLIYEERRCDGTCAKEKCYIEVEVVYEEGHFRIDHMQHQCL